jgi:hypothetical protein
MSPNLVPDRGGWHESPGDPRVHVTVTDLDTGQRHHRYLADAESVEQRLGRAAVGLSLGGPFTS